VEHNFMLKLTIGAALREETVFLRVSRWCTAPPWANVGVRPLVSNELGPCLCSVAQGAQVSFPLPCLQVQFAPRKLQLSYRGFFTSGTTDCLVASDSQPRLCCSVAEDEALEIGT
jgi:hypothetical protein